MSWIKIRSVTLSHRVHHPTSFGSQKKNTKAIIQNIPHRYALAVNIIFGQHQLPVSLLLYIKGKNHTLLIWQKIDISIKSTLTNRHFQNFLLWFSSVFEILIFITFSHPHIGGLFQTLLLIDEFLLPPIRNPNSFN